MSETNKTTIRDLCKKIKLGASSFYLKEGEGASVVLKIIRHANVTENGVIDFASIEPVLVRNCERTNDNLLEENDILIALRGTAKIAVAPPKAKGYTFSAEFAALKIDTDRIRPELIAGYLKLPQVRAYLEEKNTGHRLRTITLEDVLELTITIPDKETQARLVEFLEAASEERELVLRQQKRIDELEAAMVEKYLGDD